MQTKMTMLYWKSDKFWLGKLLEHPEIMTQGETLEELEENIKDAYLLMAMDDVPTNMRRKKSRYEAQTVYPPTDASGLCFTETWCKTRYLS